MLVSVVIPFYSYKNWLVEAIDSVLSQDYPSIEIIVVNDGSDEDITDIEEKYDKHVVFLKKNNGGAASARNLGILNAKGIYVSFLDSDDLFKVDKISRQVSYMNDTGLAWSQHSYYKLYHDERRCLVDTSMYVGDVYRRIFTSFRVQTSTVMVRRDVLCSNNYCFPENFRNGQDGEFYKAIAEKYPLGFVPDAYSDFRIRGGNVGFNPEVLLRNKSQIWLALSDPNKYQREVGTAIRFCHKVGHVCYSGFLRICEFLPASRLRKPLAGAFYIVPFILFKIVNRII